MTALELQSDLNAIAADLTERTGLADRVTHICADALTYPFPDAAFDAVVSWLAILHIPDRPRLCAQAPRVPCAEAADVTSKISAYVHPSRRMTYGRCGRSFSVFRCRTRRTTRMTFEPPVWSVLRSPI